MRYEILPPNIADTVVMVIVVAAIIIVSIAGILEMVREAMSRPPAPKPAHARPGRVRSAFARYRAGQMSLAEFRARDDDAVTEPIPVVPANRMASAA